jgi:hypothetical protein
MAIHSDKNLYPGINAHLNSFLQHEPGGWQSFHAEHIVDIGKVINEHVPQGYFARAEKTLQISEILPGTKATTTTIPDTTIYQVGSASVKAVSSTLAATPPTATLAILDTLDEEEYLTGIVIYQVGEGSLLGRPITRVELLSPANKPGGSHYGQYRVKRLETLQSGLRLVEIDYLHETAPITQAVKNYPEAEQDAYPYNILVSDPRPDLEKGPTYFYGIGVDDPMPVLAIPLAGADEMTFPLGDAYNRTFEDSPFYGLVVNYAQDPIHFERYTDADRERIRKRMAAIKEQMTEG